MQRFVCILFLILPAAFVIAEENDATGKITGTVDFCQHGGVLGMKISLSGRSNSVLTADDGKFVFDALTPGEYALFYAIDEKMLNISKGINVQSGATTDLGIVAFCDAEIKQVLKIDSPAQPPKECRENPAAPECMDKDKDGVVAAKDCDDNNEHIRPGAPEHCDGLDNNCNGEIDEAGAVWIQNGQGICEKGAIKIQSCNSGFADCDGKVDTGCEINLMDDNENCGRCGNVCSNLETCILGTC